MLRIRLIEQARKMLIIKILILIGAMYCVPLYASNDAIYEVIISESLDDIYPFTVNALNSNGYIVAYSINVGSSYSLYEEDWKGDNPFGITGVRSLLICNLKFSYQLREIDPSLLGLCPMHLTLYEKNNKETHILYNLPSAFVNNGLAKELVLEEEAKFIELLKNEILR